MKQFTVHLRAAEGQPAVRIDGYMEEVQLERLMGDWEKYLQPPDEPDRPTGGVYPYKAATPSTGAAEGMPTQQVILMDRQLALRFDQVAAIA